MNRSHFCSVIGFLLYIFIMNFIQFRFQKTNNLLLKLIIFAYLLWHFFLNYLNKTIHIIITFIWVIWVRFIFFDPVEIFERQMFILWNAESILNLFWVPGLFILVIIWYLVIWYQVICNRAIIDAIVFIILIGADYIPYGFISLRLPNLFGNRHLCWQSFVNHKRSVSWVLHHVLKIWYLSFIILNGILKNIGLMYETTIIIHYNILTRYKDVYWWLNNDLILIKVINLLNGLIFYFIIRMK